MTNRADLEALGGKAQRCLEHASRIDAKLIGEYRTDVLDRRWLESNRLQSAARRYRAKVAAALKALAHATKGETDDR